MTERSNRPTLNLSPKMVFKNREAYQGTAGADLIVARNKIPKTGRIDFRRPNLIVASISLAVWWRTIDFGEGARSGGRNQNPQDSRPCALRGLSPQAV